MRHSYAGAEGDGFVAGIIMEGTETRADVGFWITLVVICHSIASSGLSKPSGRAFSRLCICGRASIADPGLL